MCFVILAFATQSFYGYCIMLLCKPLKTLPVRLSQQSSKASSLIDRVVSLSVFSVRNRLQYPRFEAGSISFQLSFIISLIRKPVRHENKDAAFNTRILQGVMANVFSSSNIRYFFFISFSSFFEPKYFSICFLLDLNHWLNLCNI